MVLKKFTYSLYSLIYLFLLKLCFTQFCWLLKLFLSFFLLKKKRLENNLISLIYADLSSLKLYVEKC